APNAFAFDHYTHIRADLFAPRGPLTGALPPSDQLRLDPALDWIAAALPQQNAEAIAGLTGTVQLHVSGPGARTIAVGTGPVTAEMRSDAPALIRWVTQRATTDELGVITSGHAGDLAVARTFHVF